MSSGSNTLNGLEALKELDEVARNRLLVWNGLKPSEKKYANKMWYSYMSLHGGDCVCISCRVRVSALTRNFIGVLWKMGIRVQT